MSLVLFLLFVSFSVEPGPCINTGERHHDIHHTCDYNEIWSGHHHRLYILEHAETLFSRYVVDSSAMP